MIWDKMIKWDNNDKICDKIIGDKIRYLSYDKIKIILDQEDKGKLERVL